MTDVAAETIENIVNDAAVFVRRSKRYRGATVQVVNGTTLRVLVMHATRVAAEWEIAETVKAGEAWDVLDQRQLTRVVAQAGCGCGGMRSFTPDPGYSGALKR